MKTLKLLGIILITFLLIGSANAQVNSITVDKGDEYGFAWMANAEPDMAGYRLYRTSTSGEYTYGDAFAFASFNLITASPRYTAQTYGTFYFVLTAFDTEGFESLPSVELILNVVNEPPNAPGGCAILKF
jgi:hypothetical protein